jgi:hypothetical protein
MRSVDGSADARERMRSFLQREIGMLDDQRRRGPALDKVRLTRVDFLSQRRIHQIHKSVCTMFLSRVAAGG